MQNYKNCKNITQYLAIMLLVSCTFLCGGCGTTENTEPPESAADISDADEGIGQSIDDAADGNPSASAEQAKEESPQPETAPPSNDETLPDSPAAPSDKDAAEEPVSDGKLTAKELQEYTEWIQEGSNYGFLLSEWSSPAEINLYEVFYNGAGLYRNGTEAEINAFLTRHERDELYTDFFAIDKTAVNHLLKEKTGLSYDEILENGGRGMEDLYYAESDSFCLEVGDTNFCFFECTDGITDADSNVTTLYFEGDFWVKKCEVRINSDTRQFLSNHILEGEILASDSIEEFPTT